MYPPMPQTNAGLTMTRRMKSVLTHPRYARGKKSIAGDQLPGGPILSAKNEPPYDPKFNVDSTIASSVLQEEFLSILISGRDNT
jgi:hypothetical protein